MQDFSYWQPMLFKPACHEIRSTIRMLSGDSAKLVPNRRALETAPFSTSHGRLAKAANDAATNHTRPLHPFTRSQGIRRSFPSLREWLAYKLILRKSCAACSNDLPYPPFLSSPNAFTQLRLGCVCGKLRETGTTQFQESRSQGMLTAVYGSAEPERKAAPWY